MSKDVIPLTNEIRFVRLPSASTHSTPKTLFNNRFDLWLMRGVSSWQKRVLAKFCRVLSTHVLRFDMKGSSTELGRGRHRRRNQMLPAMMFGVTALGMVIIPLGFQFLAVLSGKALVLSKLALILASINGLKRIATSGLNFGLYQVPADQYHYYDRDDVNRLH
ncbi:unnamed protein product [Hermetia illucens]|uniref:Uncharacterized protein n=1 Tax=Hermetia illucens TaxID=343691 RepID=A0A7R8YZL1_HERIL|nr:unnamed protein product [Hermetia illucens]